MEEWADSKWKEKKTCSRKKDRMKGRKRVDGVGREVVGEGRIEGRQDTAMSHRVLGFKLCSASSISSSGPTYLEREKPAIFHVRVLSSLLLSGDSLHITFHLPAAYPRMRIAALPDNLIQAVSPPPPPHSHGLSSEFVK
jgi:hypothetical protein